MDGSGLSLDKKVRVNPRESPQVLKVSKKFGKIICPSRLLVCGPSLSGKSTFVKLLLEHREKIYDSDFTRVIYCSPHCLTGAQDVYVNALRTHFPDVELSSDLPNVIDLNLSADGHHKLIIVDDFIHRFNSSNAAFELLTIQSHHMLISIVVTSHNLFASSKFQKTLFRNYSEIVLLYTRSDKLALRTLGVQMFPDNVRILIKAMSWVAKHIDSYLKYLLLDVSPLTRLPQNMIIRTDIFGPSPIFFIPNNTEQD